MLMHHWVLIFLLSLTVGSALNTKTELHISNFKLRIQSTIEKSLASPRDKEKAKCDRIFNQYLLKCAAGE
jgi:hypothetical protein